MLTLQYSNRQFCNIDYRIKEYGGWWQNYIVRGLLQKQQMNNIKMVEHFILLINTATKVQYALYLIKPSRSTLQQRSRASVTIFYKI